MDLTAAAETKSFVIVTFILEADESNDNKDAETPREEPLTPPWSAQEFLYANNDMMAEARPTMQPLSQEEDKRQQHLASASPKLCPQGQGSALSLREASLMRRFIQKIAPWVRPENFYMRKHLP